MSERIVSALGSMQLRDVVIGLEATSIYGDSLVYALREDGGLGRLQRKIHVLNPKQVRKFKDTYPDLPKNDWVDAFEIADHLRFGRIAKEVYEWTIKQNNNTGVPFYGAPVLRLFVLFFINLTENFYIR